MKAVVTVFVMILNSALYSQHSTGIMLELNSTSFTNSLDEMISMQGRLSAQTGFGIHAFFNNQTTDKLNISLGIGYTYRRYEVATSEFRWPSQIHPTVGFRAHISPVSGVIIADHLGSHDFHYISVPFTACYRLFNYSTNRIKLRVGLTGTWMVASDATINKENISGGVGSFGVNTGSLINSTNFTTLAGLEIGLITNEQIAVALVPSVGIELFSTAKEIENYRLTTMSLGLQVMF